MSIRYHRRLTYQTRNPLAATNPLRSIPFMRPASVLFRLPYVPSEPEPAAPVAPVDPVRELANAEASLREYVRVYDAARAGIGEANATSTPAMIVNGRTVMAAKPFTKERIRERKSYAFKMFNKRRSQLCAARRRVEAARAALGLPALARVGTRVSAAVLVSQHPVASSSIAPLSAPAG